MLTYTSLSRRRSTALAKLALLLAALATLVVIPAGAAHAVLHGEADGSVHPYVGMVFDDQMVCSGSLISTSIFITAAHCFEQPGERVQVTVDQAGFAESSTFASGLWYPDPHFCLACGPGTPRFDTHDVAVVVLDTPIRLARYASLPSVGAVDTLANHQRVEVVGYGIQVRAKLFTDEAFTRFHAPAELLQSNNEIAPEFLKVTGNPAQGKGGTCRGDSGGPTLLGDTILGLTSFGQNLNCDGPGYAYRVDTAEARSFMESTIRQHG